MIQSRNNTAFPKQNEIENSSSSSTMKLHVEIEVKDTEEIREIKHFYQKLGLSAHADGNILRISSTDRATIYSTGRGLRIKMHPNLFRKHKRKKKAMCDAVGNKIKLKRRKSNGTRIAVLTSGGDAPGMNAVLRSCVQTAIKHGIRIYGVYRGFQGLIEGEVRELDWKSKAQDPCDGGTQLLSTRCLDFKERSGRKEAARTLLRHRINSLVVVGGEGTLVGAMKLKMEFADLVGEISDEDPAIQNHVFTDLKIVGVPGTIDNNLPGLPFADGSVCTLGSDTALNRIVEVLDRISSTMRSHRRIFIVECMGRDCGWLTMMGAYASNAEFVLLPEAPDSNWKTELVKTIRTAFYNHKGVITVFVCEGAVDCNGNLINLNVIKAIVENALKEKEETRTLDVRTLTIGHIQRGGPPSARDRIFGKICGTKSVEYLASSGTAAVCAYFTDYEIHFVPLSTVVEEINRANECTDQRQFEAVFRSRDTLFQQVFSDFERHREQKVRFLYEAKLPRNGKRVAVLYNGPVAAGANACINMLFQEGLCRGYSILYFENGLDGLKKPKTAVTFQVSAESGRGGVVIGRSNREVEIETLKKVKKMHKLDYVIILGDRKNLTATEEIQGVLLILLGVDSSVGGIGFDSALNNLTRSADSFRAEAASLRKSVSFIEINGGREILKLGGVSTDAFSVLTASNTSLQALICLRERLSEHFRLRSKPGAVVLCDASAFGGACTSSLATLISSECHCSAIFSRVSAHGCSGIVSPRDRIIGRMAAVQALDIVESGGSSCVVKDPLQNQN